jgi:hypothetical protein
MTATLNSLNCWKVGSETVSKTTVIHDSSDILASESRPTDTDIIFLCHGLHKTKKDFRKRKK